MKIPGFSAARDGYPDNLRPLTSLRFIAVVWVILYHFRGGLGLGDWLTVTKGYLGVDFFFILSGFILFHVYREKIKSGAVSPWKFYIRRLARIYPIHLFTFILYMAGLLLAFSVLHEPDDLQQMEKYHWFNNWHPILNNLLLTHGWGFEKELSFNVPTWSLSSEWFAYLLFPFIVPGLSKLPTRWIIGGAFSLLLGMWFLVPILMQNQMTMLTFNFSVLRIMPEFIFGIALYEVGRNYKFTFSARTLFIGLSGLVIVLCELQVPDIVLVILFGILIFIAAESERQGCAGLLGHKLSVWLGELSFSIYMVHYLILDAMFIFVAVMTFHNVIPVEIYRMLWFAILPATFILAVILNRFIERPARKWLDTRFAGL